LTTPITEPSWDVEGPVRAEIFMIWLNDDHLELTGPDGAKAWLVELHDTEHPVDVVERIVAGLVGAPTLVHSTSWRRDASAVILSFVVVIDPEQAAGFESAPIDRAELARSSATHAPDSIAAPQVLEHALRHLAWLAQDDEVVARTLSPEWHATLRDRVPEPFRNLA
jgi:hypothetical protein